MTGLLHYIPGFLTNVFIYILFSMGLNLQFGYTGLINFGHVAFMGLGAYTMAIASIHGWPWPLAVLAGIIAPAIASLFIGLSSLRLREDYLAIVTIGFAEIVRITINNWNGFTGGPQGLYGFVDPRATLGPNEARWVLLLVTVLLAVLVFWFIRFVLNTPWGRVLQAIREDEEVAMVLGKNTTIYKLQSFALGSAIAGIAGILTAYFNHYIDPNTFRSIVTFTAWMIMILGGTGTLWGPVAGSIVYLGLDSLTTYVASQNWLGIGDTQVSALRWMVVGVVLILLMMYRPQGILGDKEALTLDR